MWRSDIPRALRRLFAPAHRTDPAHRAALEERLLAGFDARHPRKRSTMTKIRRLAVTTVSAAALALVASQAPASVSVELGRRLVISPLPEGVSPREIAEAVRSLEDGASDLKVALRVKKEEGGAPTLVLDVWSDALPDSLATHVRRHVPALGGIAIQEERLTATAETTLGKAIGHRILHVDLAAKDLDAAREELRRRIQEEEPGAEVDVSIEEPEPGRRTFEVKVRKNVEK